MLTYLSNLMFHDKGDFSLVSLPGYCYPIGQKTVAVLATVKNDIHKTPTDASLTPFTSIFSWNFERQLPVEAKIKK